MTIIDSTTVSVLLTLVALAVLAAVVAVGIGISHLYLTNRPARATRSSVPTVRARLAAGH